MKGVASAAARYVTDFFDLPSMLHILLGLEFLNVSHLWQYGSRLAYKLKAEWIRTLDSRIRKTVGGIIRLNATAHFSDGFFSCCVSGNVWLLTSAPGRSAALLGRPTRPLPVSGEQLFRSPMIRLHICLKPRWLALAQDQRVRNG